MTLCLAGHHQPLVLSATGVVEPVGRFGMPLGLFEAAELYDSRILASAETLCLFSDGLVESRYDGVKFGPKRVFGLLLEHAGAPLEERAAGLVSSVRSFHGERLTDDLALLLIRPR